MRLFFYKRSRDSHSFSTLPDAASTIHPPPHALDTCSRNFTQVCSWLEELSELGQLEIKMPPLFQQHTQIAERHRYMLGLWLSRHKFKQHCCRCLTMKALVKKRNKSSVPVPSLSETTMIVISRWIWMHCHQSNSTWQRWEKGSCYIWQHTLLQKSDCATRKN